MSENMDLDEGESILALEEKFSGRRSKLSQDVFELELLKSSSSASSSSSSSRITELCASILNELKRSSMGPLYEFYTSSPSALLGSPDSILLSELKAKNTAELKKLDAEIVTAREGPHGGDVEAAEAMTKRANFLSQIGDSVSTILEMFYL
jgi:hypothetical protein